MASMTLSTRFDVVLDRHLWDKLPEENLRLIAERLPLASRFRFRCVCRRWRGLSFTRLYLCTIMSKLRERKVKYFCHSDEKWYTLPQPFRKDPSFGRVELLGVEWEVADVDAGFVCYQWIVEKRRLWTWILNPVTHFAQLVPPVDPHHGWEVKNCPFPRLKLHVNQEQKTFRIIVVFDVYDDTALYDSATSSWTVYRSNSGLCDVGFAEFFVWNGVFFTYRVRHEGYWHTVILALDLKLGWLDVEAEFPRFELGFGLNRFVSVHLE